MSFDEDSLKYWARGHKETGGIEAVSDLLHWLCKVPLQTVGMESFTF